MNGAGCLVSFAITAPSGARVLSVLVRLVSACLKNRAIGDTAIFYSLKRTLFRFYF